MGDALKLLDWLKDHPKTVGIPVLLAAIILVLLYETAKQLVPRLIESVIKLIKSDVETRKISARAEAEIRAFCVKTRTVNWAVSVPAIARHSLNIPIEDVFVLPKLALHDGMGTLTIKEIGAILSDHRFLCITGTPGSGKTTLLNFLAVTFAREVAPDKLRLLESRVPFCLDFKELGELFSQATLPNALSLLSIRCGLSQQPEFFARLLQQGRCALLIDGLDEAGDLKTRSQMCRWIIETMATYSDKNRVLITCRDFEWEAATFPGVARAVIQPFSTQDARIYLKKFEQSLTARSPLKGDEGVSNRFSNLSDGLSDEYSFIASSPLLMTLAVALLTLRISIPKRPFEILETFTKTMLHDWPALRSAPVNPSSILEVSISLEKFAFAALSYAQEPGVLSLDNKEVVETIGGGRAATAIWLDQIASKTGVINKLGESKWVFSNRRIQEYLAARELSRNPTLWNRHWCAPDWKDVFGYIAYVVEGQEKYLEWLTFRGHPENSLHALLVLRAAGAIPTHMFALHAFFMAEVRSYMIRNVEGGTIVDDELLRVYVREDWQHFSLLLDKQLQERGNSVHSIKYFKWAVISEYAPAVDCIARGYNDLLPDVAREILQLSAHGSVQVRLKIVDAAFNSNLEINDIAAAFIALGNDALEFLISKVDIGLNERISLKALALIASFTDSKATIYLFELISKNRIRAVQAAVETHLRLIADKSGNNLAEVLYSAKSTFYTRFGKRIFDLVFSTFAIFSVTPIFVGIAILIKLTSPGPIFYRNPRVGQDGRRYTRLTFRTMRMVKVEEGVVAQSSRRDPRVTRLGAFLRRTSLDEMPAFISVMFGEMSIVGPRLLPGFTEVDPVTKAILHRFRPGLLGKAQIEFRQSGSAFLGAQHFIDLSCAAKCTFLGDLKILARTIFVGFARSGY